VLVISKNVPLLNHDLAYKREHGLVPTKVDPSGNKIDPSSRLSIRLKVDRVHSKAEFSYTSASESAFVESDESSELTDNEDDDFGGNERRAFRRSSRIRPRNAPPFSPKKTRAQRLHLPQDSDASDDEVSRQPRRRSMRKKIGRTLNFADGIEDEQTQDSDYQVSHAKGPKKTKRKKSYSESARPAYGHFRSMDDLEYEPDEETRVLRAHRQFCERCHQPPATGLLQLALKHAKKGKKKKRTEDESEESEAEERARSLGGWVQWYVSPITWGSL
jgi:chromodomain-helicase-DNA-binding protein 4